MRKRIVGMAVLVSFVVGLLTACIAIWPAGDMPTKVGEIAAAFLFCAIVSLPISIPVGIIGGILAASIFSKNRGKHQWVWWVASGCLWGTVLGAAGPTLWFGLINAGKLGSNGLSFLAVMSAIGGIAGTIAGGIVGIYCGRLSKLTRPSFRP